MIMYEQSPMIVLYAATITALPYLPDKVRVVPSNSFQTWFQSR